MRWWALWSEAATSQTFTTNWKNKGLRFLSSVFWLMSVIVFADNEFVSGLLLPLRASFDSLSAHLDDTFVWLPVQCVCWLKVSTERDNFNSFTFSALLWCASAPCGGESTCFSTRLFWQHLVNSPTEKGAGLCSSPHQHGALMMSPVCSLPSKKSPHLWENWIFQRYTAKCHCN